MRALVDSAAEPKAAPVVKPIASTGPPSKASIEQLPPADMAQQERPHGSWAEDEAQVVEVKPFIIGGEESHR